MSEKITAADAIRLLDAHEAAAVDVREPDEFAVGHIPGAKLLPLGQVLSRAAEVLPDKNAVWLVYCRTGRRSADAVRKLESLGYTRLYDLGGILSWPYYWPTKGSDKELQVLTSWGANPEAILKGSLS